jgi:putative polyhydroxyalkanoate system protein
LPDIHIHRAHALGLAEARKIAALWVAQASEKFGMACTYEAGEDADLARFSRPGVKGELKIGGSHFEIDATLGFLLGAFQAQIEQQIEKNLDALLATPASGQIT